MASQIDVERVYRHPVTHVWQQITSESGARRWLGADGQLAQGGEAIAVTMPEFVDLADTKARVVEMRPESMVRIALTGPTLDSTLTLQLTAHKRGSQIHLTHDGLDLPTITHSRLAGYWDRVVSEDIVEVLNPPKRFSWGLAAVSTICAAALGFAILSSIMTKDWTTEPEAPEPAGDSASAE